MVAIATLSTILKADASGFVAGLAQADAAAKQRTASIDVQLDKLSKSVNKKLALGDIGKSILGGLGLGSGFAIAATAAGKITEYFSEAAKFAQDIEEASNRSLEAFERGLRLRRTDAQQVLALEKERTRLATALDEINKPKFTTVPGDIKREMGGGFIREGSKQVQRDLTKEELLQRENLKTQLQEIDNQIVESKKVVDAVTKKSADESKKAYDEQTAGLIRYYKELKKTGDAIRDSVQTPVEKYNNSLNELKNALDDTAISQGVFDKAVDKNRAELLKDIKPAGPRDTISDSRTRLGLASSTKNFEAQGKEQVSLLTKMLEKLASIDRKTALEDGAVFS